MGAAALVAGLASAVALVVSLLFLAREAREAARQTRLANETAGAQAMAVAFGGIDGVTTLFLEYPELRTYFYGSTELTDDLRARDSPGPRPCGRRPAAPVCWVRLNPWCSGSRK